MPHLVKQYLDFFQVLRGEAYAQLCVAVISIVFNIFKGVGHMPHLVEP